MKSFLTLVRVEWIKTSRMRSTYIAFAVVGLLILFVQFGAYFAVDDYPFYQLLERSGMDTATLGGNVIELIEMSVHRSVVDVQ